jgi:putative PIN family toxin of toxin-antitoxin system
MSIDNLDGPDKLWLMKASPCSGLDGAAAAAPVVVLDTNVVLDLWAFNDPRAKGLRQALAEQRLHWISTPAMFDELADVLFRPTSARWCPEPAAVLAQARAACHMLPDPVPATSKVPVCADPDDQIFIELAWFSRARWLFTRDRALLDLARPALAHGVTVTTPAAWPGLGAPVAAIEGRPLMDLNLIRN